MSSFGELDDKQFQRYADKVGDAVRTQAILETIKKRTDIVSNFALREIKKTTPIGKSRNLSRSWSKSDIMYFRKNVTVKISNSMEYASFVENGHRKKSSAKASNGNWVEGKFMMKNALDLTFEKKMNQAFHRDLDKKLQEIFGD